VDAYLTITGSRESWVRERPSHWGLGAARHHENNGIADEPQASLIEEPVEVAAKIAGHASTKINQFYDRRHEEISLDEIERIHI